MKDNGYVANQFLIAFPDVLISGDHAPTLVSLNAIGHDSEVFVCAHTAPTPLSSVARNLSTLQHFSTFGPAAEEEQPPWQKEDFRYPSLFEGKVTIFEVLVPKAQTDQQYDSRPNVHVNWDDLTHPLVRASKAINLYLVALRVVFETGISLLPNGHLPGPIFHRMCRVKESMDEVRSISVRPISEFAVGLGGTRAPELDLEVDFTDEKIADLEYALDSMRNGNQILASKDRLVASNAALYTFGDLSGAALEAATASEMFLDTVLTLLRWEKEVIKQGESDLSNISPDETTINLFSTGNSLTKRIKSEYTNFLGGEPWSLDDGIIGTWHRDCYLLRHRVIHGGYFPTFKESADSYDAVLGLFAFVLDEICKNKTKYPRTTWLLLGKRGLEKRSSHSHRYKEIFSRIVDAESNWNYSYSNYRKLLSDSMLGE